MIKLSQKLMIFFQNIPDSGMQLSLVMGHTGDETLLTAFPYTGFMKYKYRDAGIYSYVFISTEKFW